MTLVKAALGYIASAYVNDTIVRPRQLGTVARAYCDRVRKPLLLIQGAGFAATFLGAPVRADVVSRRAYPLGCSTRALGAVLAVGTLERLRRPDLALAEWRRAADKVFVVVPSWWSPHAWFDPENRWRIDADLRRARPLWTADRRVYLLSVSDTRYGQRPWVPNTQKPRLKSQVPSRATTTSMPTRLPVIEIAESSVPALPMSSQAVSSQAVRSEPVAMPVTSPLPPVPQYEPQEQEQLDASDLFETDEANLPSDSSSYPQTLMVVSELPYDES